MIPKTVKFAKNLAGLTLILFISSSRQTHAVDAHTRLPCGPVCQGLKATLGPAMDYPFLENHFESITLPLECHDITGTWVLMAELFRHSRPYAIDDGVHGIFASANITDPYTTKLWELSFSP